MALVFTFLLREKCQYRNGEVDGCQIKISCSVLPRVLHDRKMLRTFRKTSVCAE